MDFAFIDQSGYPLPNDENNFSVLSATCIKDSDIKDITKEMRHIEFSIFGEPKEKDFGKTRLKGNDMTNRSTIMKNLSQRREYTENFVQLFENFNLYVFAIVMERPDFVPYGEKPPKEQELSEEKTFLSKKYQFLMERLHGFGLEMEKDILLIYDKVEPKKDDAFIEVGTKNYLFKHEIGKKLNNIIHMPLFVSSHNTPLIRFPDMASNIIRRYYNYNLHLEPPSDDHEEWIKNLYGKIHKRTLDIPILNRRVPDKESNLNFGIYYMRKNLFSKNE